MVWKENGDVFVFGGIFGGTTQTRRHDRDRLAPVTAEAGLGQSAKGLTIEEAQGEPARRPWLTADHWVPLLEDRITEALFYDEGTIQIRVEHAQDILEILKGHV